MEHDEIAIYSERLERLNAIGIALSAERDLVKLMEHILENAKEIMCADAGTLYSVKNDALRFEIMRTTSLNLASGGPGREKPKLPAIPLKKSDGSPHLQLVSAYAAITGETVRVDDAYTAEGFDFSGTRRFDDTNNYRSQSFLTVPMQNHEGDVIGVLQLINKLDPSNQVIPFSEQDESLLRSLASQAAVALTQNKLIKELEDLFFSFAKVIAAGIDDKSPHTGRHCRRIPTITLMLAEAVDEVQEGPFAGFRLSKAEFHELELAAWLHDCGKVSTPDWIMEKATKLEKLYDRIETVETRLALLHKEREVEILRKALKGKISNEEYADLAQKIEKSRQENLQHREFIRHHNQGKEFMSKEHQAQVRELARKIWHNLDSKPQPLLNENEVENLTISKGTLTEEERNKINHHIVTTIKMLEILPFPKHLRRVPEYAGGHHERMDGKGYPRGLTREQMSVPARIMGIADVFEALTARDRPYKTPKTLSQTLSIMCTMKKTGHIDPDLFDVFVGQKVYMRYAQEYLDPLQIDNAEKGLDQDCLDYIYNGKAQ